MSCGSEALTYWCELFWFVPALHLLCCTKNSSVGGWKGKAVMLREAVYGYWEASRLAEG